MGTLLSEHRTSTVRICIVWTNIPELKQDKGGRSGDTRLGQHEGGKPFSKPVLDRLSFGERRESAARSGLKNGTKQPVPGKYPGVVTSLKPVPESVERKTPRENPSDGGPAGVRRSQNERCGPMAEGGDENGPRERCSRASLPLCCPKKGPQGPGYPCRISGRPRSRREKGRPNGRPFYILLSVTVGAPTRTGSAEPRRTPPG